VNDAQILDPDGAAMRFGGLGQLSYAADALAGWHNPVTTFALELDVRCAAERQTGPARIVGLSATTSRRNFLVGQEGSDLLIRLRRDGSDENGLPGFMVAGVFAGCQSRHLALSVIDQRLLLTIDGVTKIDQRVGALTGWDPTMPLLLGNESNWNRGWSGQLDNLALALNGKNQTGGLQNAERVEGVWLASEQLQRLSVASFLPFMVNTLAVWLDNLINVLGFLPLGLVLAAGWGSGLGWAKAGAWAAVLSLTIELGQLGFVGRIVSTTDLVTNTTGGMLGYGLGVTALARIKGPTNQHETQTGE